MVIIVVIALCALATFFLVRMRNRRRTQVPPTFSNSISMCACMPLL